MKRFLFLILITTLSGCAMERMTQERVVEIQRVYMNEPGVYSFMYKNDNQIGVFGGGSTPYYHYSIFDDVSEGKPMWVKIIQGVYPSGYVDEVRYEAHIHSVKEVEGGGWDHGKSGRGTNVVVQ